MTHKELHWHDGVEGQGLGVARAIGIGEEELGTESGSTKADETVSGE
jgi:hypothetical protein